MPLAKMSMFRKYFYLGLVSTWATVIGIMALHTLIMAEMYLHDIPFSSGGHITPLFEINRTLWANASAQVFYRGPWSLLNQLASILLESTHFNFVGAQVSTLYQLPYISGWKSATQMISLFGLVLAILNLLLLGSTLLLVRSPVSQSTRRWLRGFFYGTHWSSKTCVIIAILCYGIYVHIYHRYARDAPPDQLIILLVGFFIIYCSGLIIELTVIGIRLERVFWYEEEESHTLI
jgi:hypothetical protein